MSGVNLLPWRQARAARQRRRFMVGLVAAVCMPLLAQLVVAWALVHEQRALRQAVVAGEVEREPPTQSVEARNSEGWTAARAGLEALLVPPAKGLAVEAWAVRPQGPGAVELRLRGEAMDGATVSRLLARVREREGIRLHHWDEDAAQAGEPRPFTLVATWSRAGRE